MADAGREPMGRLGVFGGAFDPPHAAHQAMVQAAMAQLDLASVSISITSLDPKLARILEPRAASPQRRRRVPRVRRRCGRWRAGASAIPRLWGA